jgi:hypothetical protein
MGYIQHPSAPAAPPAAIMHVLSRFTRDDLAGFISVALDLLDTLDGDPEAEENDLEDGFALSAHAQGFCAGIPGDPMADAAEDDDSDRCGAYEDNADMFSQGEKMGWDDTISDDEAEPDYDGGECTSLIDRPVYGIDQSQGPLNSSVTGRVN